MRSAEEIKEIDKHKVKRRKLMLQHHNAEDNAAKKLIKQRIDTLTRLLWDLTENEIYNK